MIRRNHMLQTILLSIMVISLWVPIMQAQVVLEPAVAGSVENFYSGYACSYHMPGSWYTTVMISGATSGVRLDTDQIRAGERITRWSHFLNCFILEDLWWQGVVEFPVGTTADGGSFPTSGMTESNWRAYLSGIQVQYANHVGANRPIYLLDLSDSSEDLDLTVTESTHGDYLEALWPTIPPVGSIHAPVDITAALRRDLFGDGQGDDSTGFVFTSKNLDLGDVWIATEPLRLNIKVSPMGKPTATPMPTHTPVPSASPTPVPLPAVDLELSRTVFWPGDRFLLRAHVSAGDMPLTGQPFVVLLDVFGEYFWYPGWTVAFETSGLDLAAGAHTSMDLLDFTWPSGAGSGSGLWFIGALLTPDLFAVYGEWDAVSFEWTE